eukprot:SAG11_NODE_289_length_11184_cov_20.648083_8_plen_176_part_00
MRVLLSKCAIAEAVAERLGVQPWTEDSVKRLRTTNRRPAGATKPTHVSTEGQRSRSRARCAAEQMESGGGGGDGGEAISSNTKAVGGGDAAPRKRPGDVERKVRIGDRNARAEVKLQAITDQAFDRIFTYLASTKKRVLGAHRSLPPQKEKKAAAKCCWRLLILVRRVWQTSFMK